jgi:hypothetical protein
MDVSEIVSAYGAYYESAGQNKARILGKISQGLVTPGYCTPVKTDDTIFKLGQITSGDLVQSFQKAYTPKSSIALVPNELRLYPFKVDVDIMPDEIEATWLGFLASNSVSRQDWPLIRFLLEHAEQGIIPIINRDMETKEYGKGVYVAPTPGTASVTGQGMNGLVKLITIGVQAQTINSIDIEALVASTIFDQVELFVDGISEDYQNVAMNVFMSPYWAKMYHRDKRVQGFYQIASEANINAGIDFTPQQVVALPSLSGTSMIFATPKANMLHLTKNLNNKTNIKIEESKRTVSFLANWWEGIGFGMDGVVWSNLQKTI